MSACMTEMQFPSEYVSQEHNMCIHMHANVCARGWVCLHIDV